MIQSHLLQLLALVAMEKPEDTTPEKLREAKINALKAIVPADVACAQYKRGVVNGKEVGSYLEEPGVPPHSVTETYAALKLVINNDRWSGKDATTGEIFQVPFYLRTGKRLAAKQSIISVCFRDLPSPPLYPSKRNWVRIGIDPECLQIETTVKTPALGEGLGKQIHTRQKNLNAHYLDFGDPIMDAYEELLLDVIKGEQDLFLSYEEIDAAWQIVDPILEGWKSSRPSVLYPAGSWEVEGTLAPPGEGWQQPWRPCDEA
jgi:glucose-6-phosphate 1-dehydrogenase